MHELFFRNITGSLTVFDLAIVVGAIVILFIIALFKGRRAQDSSDFFLGQRRVPAIIACLSFVATEVSAVTITGVPATSYSENWQYLQFFVGSAAARFFVAFLFIPVFYKYNCTSIYEFLRHRFNPQTQYAGSVFFFITRLIGSGVRLYAACLAIAVIMNCSLVKSLAIFALLAIAFISFGGIKAVVWAGAYISVIFFTVGISLIVYLLTAIQGPIGNALDIAENAGRLSVFNFDFALNNPTTFWAGTANAFFICLAVFGTDQELVQRLLTVNTRKSSQKTVIATTFASLPMLCIFLTIGTLLFAFYKTNPGALPPTEAKTVLSHFVVNVLPAGLKGLFLTAVVMASVDLPLASLSSSFVYDIYRPLLNKGASEKHYLLVSRLGVAAFGLILAIIALMCQPVQSVLWFAFKVVSITGGATLGIFLFGTLAKGVTRKGKIISWAAIFIMIPACIFPAAGWGAFALRFAIVAAVAVFVISLLIELCRRRPELANTLAMTGSSACMAALLVLSQPMFGADGKTAVVGIAWSWLIVLGTILTCSLAYILTPDAKVEEICVLEGENADVDVHSLEKVKN